MPWLSLLFLLAALPANAARSGEAPGWKPTAIPLVNYSSDYGTGYGLRLSLFRYDGHTLPYDRAYSAQLFFTTRSRWVHRLYLDLPHWRPGQRLEIEALLEKEDRANYYGNLSDRAVDQHLGVLDKAARANRTTFRQVHPSLRLMWLRSLRAPWALQLEVQANNNNLRANAGEGSLLRLLHPLGASGGSLVQLRTALRYDTRDDYNNSTRGQLAELRLEFSAGRGGDFHGGQLGFEHRHFLPLRADLVLANRIDVACAFGALPFFALPALGGSDTIRGLMASRVRDRGRLLGNVELRWPGLTLVPQAQISGGLVLFADAGQTFRPSGGPNLNHWYGGAGMGGRLLWHSTIVRGDLGRADGQLGLYLTFSQVF